ncbi:MAG: NAD(P)(+) transhydrogenase (Re/Si-specific) subunit beta [Bacteroidia bacterium]|nr:NAD(P)(+) transhydrogenase (Re/Si-specific) subunit beta [Bacteroidia bacterium]NNF32379.1 NAD(P)(+) transhydrogenase (Re/Si-specific) subunit beta [Flavobacteriaceae bacterium]MBT8275069.1 NAD(P)(+) transhydrogenase (Re/Si-specific) subunit beta [Bacteroidia bacterium]NNJ81468.1 NAD(P)(+) transhydrogenase (Re/Si-specific) subunit beta [Flavobacteriaceae bacterium]NNK55420.1 NAD(P)(+) transhydrogenase (Re/Si-specific) subunit beta [Flavobacteriaceae bacterium]
MSLALSIVYLFAAVSFIYGLKLLGHPETAKRGNTIAATGMIVAILGTLVLHELTVSPFVYTLIGIAILLGTIIGWVIAIKVEMTKMPELVSLFNGFGGASAVLIGLVEFGNNIGNTSQMATIVAAIFIGGTTFSGSMIAWAKLNGRMWKDIRLPKYNLINNVVLLGLLTFAVFIVLYASDNSIYAYLLMLVALLYGVLLVIPIGGADMPVVISLLNSLTGIAAAITGVLYGNMVMLIGGILVGSAGLILTFAMCEAMNRSLGNVIFGAFGDGGASAEHAHHATSGVIKKTTVSDVAILMNYSERIIIVPGYGLAVAQAQHAIHELEQILESRGIEIKYAIHPVAGRMPGHMNVLLAETNVEYDKLAEMEDVNPEFATTDVVLVVGANDVVNPAAHNDPASPIYGMPILDVENAKQIIVNKRSMKPGYAGIENELFYNQKTSMLFGDAKSVIQELITELKGM